MGVLISKIHLKTILLTSVNKNYVHIFSCPKIILSMWLNLINLDSFLFSHSFHFQQLL